MAKNLITHMTFQDRPVQITRKRMKNLVLRVGPGGLLKVSCPYRTSNAQVEAFLRSQSAWIEGQKVPEPEITYRDGMLVPCFEEHLIVHAIPGCGKTVREGRQLRIHVKDLTNSEQIEKKVREYQRSALKDYIALRLPVWEHQCGVCCQSWNVRDMKTRWGSCNITKKTLLFSLRLIEHPSICTDLVIAHELTHLNERYHNEHFYALLDQCMPGWRTTQALLEGREDEL